MLCLRNNIDVKIYQKLGDVSDAVILWYFDAWQEWENIPKETYTRFNQSLWSVPAARWSDKILGPAFLLTMLNTTNWLLFIRFSCHQLWRCLHRSAPRRCARSGPGPRLTSDKQCIRKLARVKSGHHSPVKTASLWCFWCIEHRPFVIWILMFHPGSRLVRTDKCFVSFSTCNPNACSHWLTQAQKEADIYYSFIIGWHTLYFSSYWLSFIDLTLLHMSRLRWKLVLVEN